MTRSPQQTLQPKVGFVGLGTIGRPMVRHLLAAGHEVFVSDVDSDAIAATVLHGATRCESPAHVADHAEIVLACLPTPQVVEEVALGESGLWTGSAVRLFIDHSTIGPGAAVRIAAMLADKGVAAMDAPVSGGVAGAEAGTLSVMASGPLAAYDRCQAIFRTYGRHVVHVGERPGMGQTLKLANNMVVGATLVATCEAALFGIKGGLDPQVVLDMFNRSTARSFTSETIVTQAILGRRFDFGSRMDLMRKDLRLYLSEAEAAGAPALATSLVKQFFDLAIAAGDGAADMSRVALQLEKLAGARIQPL